MGFLKFNRVGTAAHILGTGSGYAEHEEGLTAGLVLVALLALNVVGIIAMVAISTAR